MDGIWKIEIIFLWTYENFRKLCANWLNFSQVFTNLGKLLKNLKFSMLKRSQKFAKFAKIFRILEKFHKFVRKLEKNWSLVKKLANIEAFYRFFCVNPVRSGTGNCPVRTPVRILDVYVENSGPVSGSGSGSGSGCKPALDTNNFWKSAILD